MSPTLTKSELSSLFSLAVIKSKKINRGLTHAEANQVEQPTLMKSEMNHRLRGLGNKGTGGCRSGGDGGIGGR